MRGRKEPNHGMVRALDEMDTHTKVGVRQLSLVFQGRGQEGHYGETT